MPPELSNLSVNPMARSHILRATKCEGLRVIHNIPIMSVYENERNLNANRFERFSMETFPNIVKLKFFIDIDSRVLFTQWVNWIADHTSDRWSLYVERLPDENHFECYFSFESGEDAVMFKMVMV